MKRESAEEMVKAEEMWDRFTARVAEREKRIAELESAIRRHREEILSSRANADKALWSWLDEKNVQGREESGA